MLAVHRMGGCMGCGYDAAHGRGLVLVTRDLGRVVVAFTLAVLACASAQRVCCMSTS